MDISHRKLKILSVLMKTLSFMFIITTISDIIIIFFPLCSPILECLFIHIIFIFLINFVLPLISLRHSSSYHWLIDDVVPPLNRKYSNKKTNKIKHN